MKLLIMSNFSFSTIFSNVVSCRGMRKRLGYGLKHTLYSFISVLFDVHMVKHNTVFGISEYTPNIRLVFRRFELSETKLWNWKYNFDADVLKVAIIRWKMKILTNEKHFPKQNRNNDTKYFFHRGKNWANHAIPEHVCKYIRHAPLLTAAEVPINHRVSMDGFG